MKKLGTLFSMIALLGLLLSACGGGSVPIAEEPVAATEAPAAAPEAPVATEAPAKEAATLTLWVYDDGRLEVLKKLGGDFEAEYGVALNFEQIEGDVS